MNTVTPAILRGHFETDLIDESLQRLIDEASEEIVRRFGANGTVTEEFVLGDDEHHVGRRRIWTKQPIFSVTSVKEGVTIKSADLVALTLNVDYMLNYDGLAVERLNGDFLSRVQIIYVPKTDEKRRDRVIIDLCKLSIQFNGLDSERVGDWNGSLSGYEAQREEILSTLSAGRRFYA